MKRLALLLAAGFILLAGLSRLKFDTEVLNLLPADLPEVRGLREYQRYFSRNDELIVSLSGNSPEAAARAAEAVATALSEQTNLVAHAVWQPPWLDRPEETAEFLAWLWLSEPPEKVEELRDRLSGAEAVRTLEESRDRLATSLSPVELARLGHDPFGLSNLGGNRGQTMGDQNWFSSADGTLRLVFVQPRGDLAGTEAWSKWLRAIREVIDARRGSVDWPNGVRIGFTGTPVFTVEIAESMERDMKQSIACTVVLIALLFWWAHRRFWPLGWMLVFLVGSLAGAMALGGLIYGSLNVVSLGFAAILLGLGVDYALVSYQELIENPAASAREVRRVAGPGIWWSAGTTALAFALLNFAGLPGLGQLGTLVAIGILTAAAAMLFGFLPAMTLKPPTKRPPLTASEAGRMDRLAWPATGILVLIGGVVLIGFWPGLDRTTAALGTADSGAATVAKEIEERMSQGAETLWLVIEGATSEEVRNRLETLEQELKQSANGHGISHELPLQIWPHLSRQKRNLEILNNIAREIPALEHAAGQAGFTDEALDLTRAVMAGWERFQAQDPPVLPRAQSAKWLVERVAVQTETGWAALGLLQLDPATPVPAIQTPGVLVAGWPRIAEALLRKVETRLFWLTAAMALALSICLRLALGSWKGVALSLATLAFGLMLTLVVMALFQWRWNLMSLTAIPLLLGAAVDYTIHVQLALRRHHGNTREMRRTIGRALFLVTAGAVAGFGSLAFASNAGLASFEIVCAVGMISIFFVAIFLLPAWWHLGVKPKA